MTCRGSHEEGEMVRDTSETDLAFAFTEHLAG